MRRTSKTRRGNETSYETLHEMKDETNKNDTSKQRDDRMERTRRPHGKHKRDGGTRRHLGNERSVIDKENQAHEKKHQITIFIARPLTACSSSPADLK